MSRTGVPTLTGGSDTTVRASPLHCSGKQELQASRIVSVTKLLGMKTQQSDNLVTTSKTRMGELNRLNTAYTTAIMLSAMLL
jgi:hypothetical protein